MKTPLLPRRFLRSLSALPFLGALSCAPVALAASATSVQWICSTETQHWREKAGEFVAPGALASGAMLALDPQQRFQTIDGFGGCFNELGWEALTALPAEKREAALKELFAPEGANFTLGRAPIGANDFSLGWYSLDETPGDYAMKDFSIARNRDTLIPFIKAAMKYQPKLGIWATPWCPPSWMTTNGRYRQGKMKRDPQTLAAYALYFSKFVQAWRAEGINLYAVHPQNEMALNTNVYPQCVWDADTLNVFLRDHLLPQLRRDQIDIEVWLGTVVNEDLAEYVDPVLGDPVTGPGIVGVGYQYGGQKTLLATHEKYPAKKLAQTETECYGGGNAWDQALLTFGHLIEDTTHFANSYFFWNIVLDESGLSRWNWRQNSLLTVDRKTETVRYNPEFYAMKHFSAFVLPGAQRIAVSGGPFKDVVAFQNPDGSRVLIIGNATDQEISTTLDADGTPVRLKIPAQSMNTLMLR
jgi:glucosylceramidase